jgi:uncharacterized membrane protein YbhN (UPF0104 family)
VTAGAEPAKAVGPAESGVTGPVDAAGPVGAAGEQPPTRRTGRRPRKHYAVASVVLGTLLAAAGMYFVIKQIVLGWSDYGEVISAARWGWLIPAVLVACAGMSSLGVVWTKVITTLGGAARTRDVFVWYQIGNLGKYIPGGIFQVVGRGELATRGGVPRAVAYNSVALSMGATYLCGGLVSAILLPFALLENGSIGSSWWVFLIIPIGLIALHPAVLRKVFAIAERVFGKGEKPQVPSWTASVGLVARHAPGWLLNGLACWLVALCFDPSAPFFIVMFAGIVSWVAGFLVIVVPSGLGVREAIFTAITAASMASSTAATISIVSRLVFVAGDLLGAALAVAIRDRRGVSSQPAT